MGKTPNRVKKLKLIKLFRACVNCVKEFKDQRGENIQILVNGGKRNVPGLTFKTVGPLFGPLNKPKIFKFLKKENKC